MWEDKETTAPDPSVAPDGEQPSALARTDSITDIEETHKQFGKIQIMTMPELMETRFRVRPVVIDGLLPAGTYLLAGAPKIGKSWLALALCLCVVKGEALWSFAAQKCGVLYLCLEDSYQRIRCRLLDLTEDAPDTLYFSVMSAQLHNGLEQQIEQFLSEHPNTGLVVIDTLQRVRSSGDNGNPYANDYRDLSALKHIADAHGIGRQTSYRHLAHPSCSQVEIRRSHGYDLRHKRH